MNNDWMVVVNILKQNVNFTLVWLNFSVFIFTPEIRNKGQMHYGTTLD